VVLTTEAILNIANYSLLCTVLRATGDVKNYTASFPNMSQICLDLYVPKI
jgi:hypothetical protein